MMLMSLWQIWLQGSDFDIDKAYILGSGFNGSGQMDLWTNISQYSSIEQLNELEKLPIPSGTKVEFKTKGVDLTEEFNMFYNYFDSLQSGAGESFFNQINSKDSF